MRQFDSLKKVPASLLPKEPYKLPVGRYKLPPGVKTVSAEEMADGPAKGKFHTKPFICAKDRRATVEVETAQGDKVKLTYEHSTSSMEYLRTAGSYVPGLPIVHTSEETFSMEVQGDLDEQEQADMAAFQEQLFSIIENFLYNNAADAGDTSGLAMSEYDSLSEYAMALDAATSISWASEMVLGYVHPGPLPPTPNRNNPPQQVAYEKQQTSVTETVKADPEVVPTVRKSPKMVSGYVNPPQQVAYENQQANITEIVKAGPEVVPTVRKLSKLVKITQEVFAEQIKTTESDVSLKKLDILEKDFSGVIEQLIAKFEDHTLLGNYLENWV